MKKRISSNYLYIPVNNQEQIKKVHLLIENTIIHEIDIQLGVDDFDYYSYVDLSTYAGKDIEIKVFDADEVSPTENNDVSDNYSNCFIFHNEKPHNIYPYRPQLHFSPETGWINDPNGLIYNSGIYHLFYQYNPYGTQWNNMHWGHAISKDLVNWQWRDIALFPDEDGSAFSGCGICDKKNLLGFGKDSLIFYYTAAGGKTEQSRKAGKQFTQRMFCSSDGADTFKKNYDFKIAHIADENRDPKIFYHKPSEAYIMVLYLTDWEFLILRSTNLMDWTETQRISIEGMWECPDLFELAVNGKEDNKKWVFWSADGYYVVGSFDGYFFNPETKRKSAYATKKAYAAQTFYNTPGRTVSLAWLTQKNNYGNYRGIMSLPLELGLKSSGEHIKISFNPVKEIEERKNLVIDTFITKGETKIVELSGKAMALDLKWDPVQEGNIKIFIGTVVISIDLSEGNITCGNDKQQTLIDFDRLEELELNIYIDQEAIEFFAASGTIYGVLETEEDILSKSIKLVSDSEAKCLRFFKFKDIYTEQNEELC